MKQENLHTLKTLLKSNLVKALEVELLEGGTGRP